LITEPQYFHTIIIGAGPAGLRATFDIADMGFLPLLIDREEKSGGKLKEIDKWFSLDSCGFCRLLDAETRPILLSEENEILCLRHGIAKRNIPFWSSSAPVSVKSDENGFEIEIARGCGEKRIVKCSAVIITTGLEDSHLSCYSNFLAGRDPDVISAIQFEKLISYASPKPITRPSDSSPVKSIAFIACAGSRDNEHPWCSASCCSYLAREIGEVKKIDPSIQTILFYMDLRLYGKGMFLYGKNHLEGTRLINSKPAQISRSNQGSLIVTAGTESGIEKFYVDMVVLSGGNSPQNQNLFKMFDVETDRFGFPVCGSASNPLSTTNPRVFVAGSARNPCDIATSVMEGRAAASSALKLLLDSKGEKQKQKNGKILVIGGGISGLYAADSASSLGYDVAILEKEKEISGIARNILLDPHERNVNKILNEISSQILSKENVRVITGEEAVKIEGRPSNFRVKLRSGKILSNYDSIIIATGAPLFQDSRVDGKRILNLHQAEKIVQSKKTFEKDVVFIQCTGSRDDFHPYCNRICCPKAVTLAEKIAQTKACRVWILFRDMMMPGIDEILYEQARNSGVIFVRFSIEAPPSITEDENGEVIVKVYDQVIQRTLLIKTGLLVLSSGVESPSKTLENLGIECDESGFGKDDDTRMRPGNSTSPGIYICGNARTPCDSISASISGTCAGMGAAIFTRQIKTFNLDFKPSWTKENLCTGCSMCVYTCPAGARFISYTPMPVANVLEPLCRACGLCSASCPSSAAQTI